jgi:NAD-dependent SIR2 family protein deacetylase
MTTIDVDCGTSDIDPDLVARIGDAILDADALLIATGAGMGVAGGIPTVRGKNASAGGTGAWPPRDRGSAHSFSYRQMVDPRWFGKAHSTADGDMDSVNVAYAYWQCQWNAFTARAPHRGYDILRKWSATLPLSHGAFVFTSNVDGHHEESGFPAECIHECHGSIRHMQCAEPCTHAIRPARGAEWRMTLNAAHDRATSAMPACDACGGVARPNIMMFNDGNWIGSRSSAQERRYRAWLDRVFANDAESDASSRKRHIVILEIGAGVAITSTRDAVLGVLYRTAGADRASRVHADMQSRMLALLTSRAAAPQTHDATPATPATSQSRMHFGATLVRINPEFSEIKNDANQRHISARVDDSLALLEAVDAYIARRRGDDLVNT